MATDQITDKNILKSWFKRGLKPLEAQFHAWMDSYWHKDDKIPVASVNNLADVLNKKAESKSLEAHVQDMTIHKTQSEQQKLDNLADNPGATYATKDDIRALINDPDVIIIPVDFTTDTYKDDTLAYVRQLYEEGTLWEKPVYLKYIWKSSYTSATPKIYNAIISGVSNSNRTVRSVVFNSPVAVNKLDNPGVDSSYCIKITQGRGFPGISWIPYIKHDECYIVQGFGIPEGSAEGIRFSLSDDFTYVPALREVIGRALLGHKQVIFLRDLKQTTQLSISGSGSNRDKIIELSGLIFPIDTDNPQHYQLKIVSDAFDVNVFGITDNGLNLDGVYMTCYKIPLPDDCIHISRIQVVQDYPEDLSQLQEGDIIIKEGTTL